MTSTRNTKHLEELDDLCLDEFDLPADAPTSYVGIWREWRDAVRAHLACIAEQDAEYHARQEQFRFHTRHIGLPTSFARGMAQRLWEDAAAKQRALGGVPTHGYVAKTRGKYEAVCPEHPRFRLVAWSHQSIPLLSAREHNAEHHSGWARVYDAPDRVLTSMMS